jgi:acyl-CoA thioesterase FadM
MNNEPQSAEINYLAESRFDEEIIIKTSVENGPDSFYNHSIFRTNDNKELCRIRIEWKKNNNK